MNTVDVVLEDSDKDEAESFKYILGVEELEKYKKEELYCT